MGETEKRCEGCRHWERRELDPDALGVCSLLGRRGGTVSTFLEREGEARLTTSRHFGCVLWQARR